MWTLDLAIAGAVARACFIVAIFTLGTGATSIPGGIVPAAPPLNFSRWSPFRRDDAKVRGH
jgi:hypothetical protein